MSLSVSVRRLTAREWRTYRDLRLRALADAPDAFGSTLDAEAGRSDAEWIERLEAGTGTPNALPLIAEANGTAVGLAWGRVEPSAQDEVGLYQMWVAPEVRGHGVGRLLLDAVVAWASAVGARRVALGVTCGDTAARRLYARAAFRPVGQPTPLRPGSALRCQRMERDLHARAG